MKKKTLIWMAALAFIWSSLAQAEGTRWSVEPFVGFNSVSTSSVSTQGIGAADGSADVASDTGFAAGLGLNYLFNENWSMRVAWDYRSVESSTTLIDASSYPEGNLASNLFYLSGVRHFDAIGDWRPHVGLGVVLGQEIDIDLEQAGVESSFSSSGDLGLEVLAGVQWHGWDIACLNFEIRYATLGEIVLEGETNSADTITIDYAPITAQLGIVFPF